MSFLSTLMEMRNTVDTMRGTIDRILESNGAARKSKVILKLTKSGKPRKVSDRKGKPSSNGDWIKKVKEDHGDELKAFHEASEDKRGTTMKFASKWRNEHESEYTSWLASWKETQATSTPDTISVTSAAADLEEQQLGTQESSTAPAPAPAPAPATATATAPAKPKKQVKKAQKAVITTAIVEPITDKLQEELLPFILGKVTYLRKGNSRSDGNHLWTSGHLWISEKGAKGSYCGQIQDGVIDKNASEPTA